MATTILSALSFAIYEAPSSCVLFTREKRVQELLLLGDLGRPISFVSHMQAMVFKPVSCCFFLFLFVYLFFCPSVSRKAREMYTLAWNRCRESCSVRWELLGEVDVTILCPSHIWCKWTQFLFLMYFLCFWYMDSMTKMASNFKSYKKNESFPASAYFLRN